MAASLFMFELSLKGKYLGRPAVNVFRFRQSSLDTVDLKAAYHPGRFVDVVTTLFNATLLPLMSASYSYDLVTIRSARFVQRQIGLRGIKPLWADSYDIVSTG